MIGHFLNSISFPFRIQTADPYSLEFESQGTLIDQPEYGKLNDSFWGNLDKEGWFTCRAGYAVFVKRLPGGVNKFLVLHGLKVKPFWKQQGRAKGVSIVLEIEKIEKYASDVLSGLSRMMAEIDSKSKQLVVEQVHEIRSMNTSLYHVGYELQQQLLYDKQKLPLAKNVVALSELISARIELSDLTSSSLERNGQLIAPTPVYRKFDKIVKCYIAYAAKREVSFLLKGDSHSQTRGIEHFEMIPLIVIDNAVKYSPDKREIEVSFNESEAEIRVDVKSLGPKIEPHEYEAIFDRDFRGQGAINSGKNGNGKGLYFARRLMDHIDGVISVSQEPSSVTVQAKQYFLTIFTLVFRKQ